MSTRAAWRLETLGFSEVYDYTGGKLDWFASGLPRAGEAEAQPRADAAVQRDVPTCRLAERLGDVQQRMRARGWRVCVVVNEERVVLGLLREKQLQAPPDVTVEQVMENGPSTFRPHLTLDELVKYLREHDVDCTLITTQEGRLIGSLDRSQAERRLEDSRRAIASGRVRR